jgi:hypothetical protein
MPIQFMGYIKRIVIYSLLVIPGILILLLGKTSYGDRLPTVVKDFVQGHFSIILTIYILLLLTAFMMYKYFGVFSFTDLQKDRERLKGKAEIRDMKFGVNRQ